MTSAAYTASIGFTVPTNCKVMALCDDTVETVVGVELISNPAPLSATTGYTGVNASLSVVANAIRSTNAVGGLSGWYTAITTVVGKLYSVEYRCNAETVTGNINFSILDFVSALELDTESLGTVGSSILMFTATGTSTHVRAFTTASSTATQTFDVNITTARLADEDFSGNGKGLQHFGSLSKVIAATNSTTVLYGGFSASNYLGQGYNSALDMATTMHIAGWFKTTNAATEESIIARLFYSGALSGSAIYVHKDTDGKIKLRVTDDAGVTYDTVSTTSTVYDGLYHKFDAVMTGGILSMYLDGYLEAMFTMTAALGSLANALATLTIGIRNGVSLPWLGSLAGVRIGTVAPTAAQVKTMHEDEAYLFKIDSLFTVNGQSYSLDLVTASYPRSRPVIRNTQKSLSGFPESLRHREEVTYDVTTTPITGLDIIKTRRFLRNVDNAQPFVFDPKGTIAVPYDPVIAVIESEGESESQQNYDYNSTSFKVRVL